MRVNVNECEYSKEECDDALAEFVAMGLLETRVDERGRRQYRFLVDVEEAEEAVYMYGH